MASDDQQNLPGTNYAKVKFVGMSWELVATPEIRDEVVFKVTGMVVAVGEEVLKDDIRKVAKVKVTSVEPA